MTEVMVSLDPDQLAERIRIEVDDAEKNACDAIRHALKAGHFLIQAKAAIDHGKFEAWITAMVPNLAIRTAQAYMRLVRRHWAMPPSKAQRVALLPLREAMKAIATPSTAPPARTRRSWGEGQLTVKRNDFAGRIRAATHGTKRFSLCVEIGKVKQSDVDRYRRGLMDAIAVLDAIDADLRHEDEEVPENAHANP